MNITHPNGTWPCVITGLDVKNLTDRQVQFIGHAIANDAVVVIKGQNLSVDEEVAFGNKFGVVAKYERKNNTGVSDEEQAFSQMCFEHPALLGISGVSSWSDIIFLDKGALCMFLEGFEVIF